LRIAKICAYAISGTAGTYPPTFLQVDFFNEEFMQSVPAASASARDSLIDAGGPGTGPPCVGLYIPDSQRSTIVAWGTANTTVVAEATGLPASARVLWHITLQFKF